MPNDTKGLFDEETDGAIGFSSVEDSNNLGKDEFGGRVEAGE